MLWVLEKIRNLPETNSSSAHVFNINRQAKEADKVKNEMLNFLEKCEFELKLSPEGETKFGWEFKTYTNWKDIWNWLLIAAHNELYSGNAMYIKILMNKLKNFICVSNVDISVMSEKEFLSSGAYIDNESKNLPLNFLEKYPLENILTGVLETGNDECLY